jgi:hypothetical protein
MPRRFGPPNPKEVYLRLRVRDDAGYQEWARAIRDDGAVWMAYTQLPRDNTYLINMRLEDASMLSIVLKHSSHPAILEFEQLTKKGFNELRAVFDGYKIKPPA